MPKGQGITTDIATGMGVAAPVASVIPGIGPIVGAGLGLGSQVMSWILGSQKYNWGKWKDQQIAGIDAHYDMSESKARDAANKVTQATIGQTTNAQALASGVAGLNSPGRINAQTYANITQNRDQAISSITNALEQNRAAMKSGVERDAAQESMTEDFNAPTTLTYVDNFVKSLQTPVMQEGIGAIIAGGVKGANWLGSLFKGGLGTTNKGFGAAVDKGTGGMAYGNGINTDVGFTGNKFNPVGPINWATPSTMNLSNKPAIMGYFAKNRNPFLF